ncbi:putative transmembrane domain-containing protein [Cryptosporidium canis]|uniref:Transmembrane domain-containing protein n=1 Tax=Cryptosporidium canis TaxID=195482 RepID=A0ABQ8P6Z3_9CRYT|nr:putative transmembrane domain-containing protein [Cryptosporidium canis]KAJ1611722.1 putative transmembrane domain-containing protein [Cryptosporidium canis]
MILRSNLFYTIDQEQLENVQDRIIPLQRLIVYFALFQGLFGAINLFYGLNPVLGLFEIVCSACFGIIVVYTQIPITYAFHSILSIFGCLVHYNSTNKLNITFSDLVSVIFICGIVHNLCCSLLSLKVFLIITDGVNWESKLESISGNLHIVYFGYPRFNNYASNIGYYTTMEDESI